MTAQHLDKLTNSSIVKPSDKETPLNSATNTIQGLTDHAGVCSMAAESYSNVALSSRQLLKPAPLARSAVDGSFVAQPQVAGAHPDSANSQTHRRIIYVPPEPRAVHALALAACDQMKPEQPMRSSATEVMQGLSHFLNCVALAQAHYLNRGGARADQETDLLAA